MPRTSKYKYKYKYRALSGAKWSLDTYYVQLEVGIYIQVSVGILLYV